MDGKHLENVDKRPKRRKDRDNPYTIYTIGLNTSQPRYYVAFRDSIGVDRCMEIEKVLFDAFDEFELDDLSFLNEVDNHYERSEQSEYSLNKRAFRFRELVEETVTHRMEKEVLHRAIAHLPAVQRRRLVLYFLGKLTYAQIAELEGCTPMPVKRSIDAAIKKLKKFLT